jgi:transposase
MSIIQEAPAVRVTAEERAVLERWAGSPRTEYHLRQRARIVLLAAEGRPTRAIARDMGCTIGTASKWRLRFARKGLAGLDERGRRGTKPRYGEETNRRILALLDRPPPEGHGRWTAKLIAAELGDVSDQHIRRFLRAQKIDLGGRKSWCVSSDPAFAAKALKATSFTSVSQPRDHIDDFIKAYNQNPRPFAWSQTMLYQKTLKPRFATL